MQRSPTSPSGWMALANRDGNLSRVVSPKTPDCCDIYAMLRRRRTEVRGSTQPPNGRSNDKCRIRRSAFAEEFVERLADFPEPFGGVAPLGGQRALHLGRLLAFQAPTEFRRQIRAALPVHGQSRGHEAAPKLGRHRAAADLAERLVVVASDPDSDHEIARKADEQGVTVFLRGACL